MQHNGRTVGAAYSVVPQALKLRRHALDRGQHGIILIHTWQRQSFYSALQLACTHQPVHH